MIMPFGKHKGKDLEEIPSDYLQWIMDKVTDNEELSQAAEEEFAFRSTWKTHFYSDRE